MTPTEVTQTHTHLLRCALEAEDARVYWRRAQPSVSADTAFNESWFGARSLERVKTLLNTFKARFDAFPHGLAVLREWTDMDPGTRAVICHWHIQLADPVYRAFTGQYLPELMDSGRLTVTRAQVQAWVARTYPDKWTHPTVTKWASNLLATAKSAGLIKTSRDPRPLVHPRVGDHALAYLLYLLRGVAFEGTLLENPYFASVGLNREGVELRLRSIRGLHFRRQGDLVDFGWAYPDLQHWAGAELHSGGAA